MNVTSIISFLLFAIGLFLFIDFRMSDLPKRRTTLKQRIAQAKRPAPSNPLILYCYEVKQILVLLGVRQPTLALLMGSAILAIFGVVLATILENMFLIPVLLGLFAALPLLLIKAYWNRQEQQMAETLESALGMITTSYLRGNNTFVRAVEENLPQIQDPVRKIFRAFLIQTRYIDTSVIDALTTMKLSIHNDICRQWIDTIIRCQSNQTLKVTLPRILTQFSEERTVMSELSILLAEPKRTYFIMLGAACCSPFLLYLLNQEWWALILHNSMGKMLLAFQMLTIAISLVFSIKAMTPTTKEEHE